MADNLQLKAQYEDIVYPSAVPFVLVHLACLTVLWSGVTWQAVVLGLGLYWLRIFAIGAGYHRYFSHRAFATSRSFQFVLAVLAQSTAQKSMLWWAAKHRHHHLYSDTEDDVHSPRRHGFLYSHLGWIFARRNDTFASEKVGDLMRYSELRWLHRHERLPALALAVLCYLIAGWPGLVIGFFCSTVLVYHATFCINSLAHVCGRKRYVTGDDSCNNWLLALFTMGEGWHNNHHACQASVQQGFRWWEIDATYYLLKLMAWSGLVWHLQRPSPALLRNEQRLGSRVIERAARQLAASFNFERIAARVAGALERPSLCALQQRLKTMQHQAGDILSNSRVPQLPTRAEISARARAMFVRTPSIDDIVDRAYGLVLDAIGARLRSIPVCGGSS